MLYTKPPAQIIDICYRPNQGADIQDTVGGKGAVPIGQHKDCQKQHQRQQSQDQTINMTREGSQDAAYKRMNQHGKREKSDDNNQFCGFILLSGVPADIFINGR